MLSGYKNVKLPSALRKIQRFPEIVPISHTAVESYRSFLLEREQEFTSNIASDAIDAQHFVVNHDWGALLGEIDGFSEGEFHLPYEKCLFEIELNNIRFFAFAAEGEEYEGRFLWISLFQRSEYISVIYTFENNAWKVGSDFPFELISSFSPVLKCIDLQMRAVSILLETGLGELEEVPAVSSVKKPHRRRGICGNIYQPGFRVVTLSPAYRQRPHAASTAYQGVVRCHFRRGHWANLHGKRVWRKWTIVGNPDLGFVDKRYVMGAVS